MTTHHLYASQKNVELVCGFYGMNHPKCKEVLQKDDELYKNFILQFTSKNGKQMGVCGSHNDSSHNDSGNNHTGVKQGKEDTESDT